MASLMKGAIPQALSIVVLAAALSAGDYLLRPEALPWDAEQYEIDLQSARDLEGTLWVDARLEADYQAGHLPDAVLLAEEDWESGFISLLEVWEPGAPIVIYCSSTACLRSHHAAKRLRSELGWDEVYSLRDGWEALQEAGLVEEDSP